MVFSRPRSLFRSIQVFIGPVTRILPVLAAMLLFPAWSHAGVFVVPHVPEVSGRIETTQHTFDTQFFMTYSGGLAGSPAGAGATVDLFVFDQGTGQPMKGSSGAPVCDPCSFTLDGTIRSRMIRIDDLITAAGGFPSPTVLGFMIAVVSGDADGVNITSAAVNSKTSPLDLSVFVFEPLPITVAP